MGFEGEIIVGPTQDNVTLVAIKSKDSKYLIGRNGDVLADMQMLINKIAKKQGVESFLDIDVNDYKKEKSQYLKGLAKHYAEQVIASGKEKEVDGFSAYERRVIHTELKKYSGVISESRGEKPNRILVVKPA